MGAMPPPPSALGPGQDGTPSDAAEGSAWAKTAARPSEGATEGSGLELRDPGFWFFAAHLWTIFGLALSNACLGLTAIFAARRGRRLARPWNEVAALLVPLTVYTLFLVASIVGSLDRATSLPELKEVFSLATLPLALLWVRGEAAARRVVTGVLVVGTLVAVQGIGQNYLGEYGTLHRRIVGLFSHYQTLAGILLLTFLLLSARLLTRGHGGSGRRRALEAVALVLVVWALLLTLTRGAWVAAIVTVAIALLVRARRYLPIYAGLALVAVVIFASLAPDSWNQRMRSIVDLQDPSNYDRLCMAEAGLYMVSERPLFGLGPRVVAERYPIYRHPTAPRFTVPHLHNSFLQLAAEQGLLSLLAYGWLMVASLALAWRGYRRDGGFTGPRADLYLGVILAVVGFNLAGLFEANWRDTEIQRWMLFLLTIPCALPARRPNPAEGDR